MRRGGIPVTCAAAAVAVGAAGASAAGPVQIQLPIVGIGLPGQPPLASRSSGAQGFYLGKMRIRERVVVDVDRAGAPTSVRVLHRIALRGKGDYKLVVPGPIDDLAPFPGEERQPGLRADTLLWQGFSPGRRVLGAIAHLRLAESAPYLPLQLTVSTHGRAVELRIENRTAARFPALVGDPRPADAAAVLDDLRGRLRSGRTLTPLTVQAARAGTEESFTVAVAFAVRGTLSAGGRRTAFDAVVGAPRTVRIADVPAGAAPKVELVATPVPVPSVLDPPGAARTWGAAASAGGLSGRDLVRVADRALLQLELTRKYGAFLEPPSRFAPTTTSYAYRTAAAPPPAAAAGSSTGGGGGVLVPVLAAVLGVLGVGALAVLWAHS